MVAALHSDSTLVEPLVAAAIAAGAAILGVRGGGLAVATKPDSSPVTEADHAAEAIILARLKTVAPAIPVVAEEDCAAGRVPAVGDAFFLVDPLDGTKEFVRGGDDFTVNIGLVRAGVPVLGVVFAPATGVLHAGVLGAGAWTADVVRDEVVRRRSIAVRDAPAAIHVVASRSHRTPETDAYIARYTVGGIVSVGSSLKFCVVAEGRADLYPRMGPTMQWDTAAGDAVLRAAGGRVVTLDGEPLAYGPRDGEGADAFLNPWFVAAGRLALAPIGAIRTNPQSPA